MRAPIFLSYPKPWYPNQQEFIARVQEYFCGRGFEPRTLGVTDYDMDAPLQGVRRLLLECNGFAAVALRRAHFEQGTRMLRGTDGNLHAEEVRDEWLTTPWAHIEPAMAFQVGLPIVIFRERGVVVDGVLDPGVAGIHMPEIDLDDDLDTYFGSNQWLQPISQWEGRVRQVMARKGRPPSLYED